jgi:hypothetical protein
MPTQDDLSKPALKLANSSQPARSGIKANVSTKLSQAKMKPSEIELLGQGGSQLSLRVSHIGLPLLSTNHGCVGN